MICYKKSSFGIHFFSYSVGYFENFLEETLIHFCSNTEVGLKLFFVCTLEIVVGPL